MAWHWLLPQGFTTLETLDNVSTIQGAHFFSGGQCVFLSGQDCTIYDQRPLECRLSPLALLVRTSDPIWVLDLKCAYSDMYREDKSFQVTVVEFSNGLSGHIDDLTWSGLCTIGHAMGSYWQLREGYDFMAIGPALRKSGAGGS